MVSQTAFGQETEASQSIPSIIGFNTKNQKLTKPHEEVGVVLRSSTAAVKKWSYFESQEHLESLDLNLQQVIPKKWQQLSRWPTAL